MRHCIQCSSRLPVYTTSHRTYRNVDHDSISACARQFYVVVARTLNSNSQMHCTDLTYTMRLTRMDKQSQTFLSCILRVLHIRRFYAMVARHSVVNSRPQICVNEDVAVIVLHGLMRLETFGLLPAYYVLKDIVYISKKKNRHGAGH